MANNNNNKAASQEFKNKTGIAIIVFGILISSGILAATTKPWSQLLTKQAEVNGLTSKVNSLQLLESERLLVEDNFNQLVSFFPSGESGIAKVAENLEELAARSGLIMILNFEDFPQQVDVGGVYRDGLVMNVVLEGSYQGVISWLRSVEALPFFIKFTEISISLPIEGTGIKAELDGLIYMSTKQ